MRLCIIPDLHNRVEIAEKIIEKENNSVDQFNLLGDYFDNFFDGPEDVTKAANFLKLYCNDPKFKFLIGNHDLHYIISHNVYETVPILNVNNSLDDYLLRTG